MLLVIAGVLLACENHTAAGVMIAVYGAANMTLKLFKFFANQC